MRILHYIKVLRHELGGPTRAVIDLSGALAAAGHDAVVATRHSEAWPEEWSNNNTTTGPGFPKLWKLESRTWPMRLFSPRQLREFRARLRGFQVLHLHGAWGVSNVQVASVARGLGIPYVISPRGMLDDWPMSQRTRKKKLFLALFGRKVFEMAAFVHCTAEGELAQSGKWFPKGRGTVIPNLIDLKPYHNLPGPDAARERFPILTNGRPSVLFLSRIHYKKGIEVLLEAAALLRDSGVEVNIVIAGAGESNYVEVLTREVSSRGLASRVEFLGMVTSPLKESLFQACHVLALPTSQENFGFVFYESLACGLPVVTTFGVDTWPELKSSGGAVIVDRDARAFADSIKALLSDDSKREAMGRSGRAWVMENLDSAKVCGLFERAYERAIAENRRG